MSEIDARLGFCKAGIVVWSSSSVKNDHVKAEADRLRKRECLLPVYIEECAPPSFFELIQGIKCRDRHGLTNEELVALSEAIRRITMIDSTRLIQANDSKSRSPAIHLELKRLLACLHIQQLLVGVVLGAAIGYKVFQWSESIAKDDLDGFIESAGKVPPEEVPLTFDSKFPNSQKPITFVRMHIPQRNGWAGVIVDRWQEHYDAQKRFVVLFCKAFNEVKMLYRQELGIDGGAAVYLKQQKSNTLLETRPGFVWQTRAIDLNPALVEYLKSSRCLGDELSSPRYAEAPRSEPDQ